MDVDSALPDQQGSEEGGPEEQGADEEGSSSSDEDDDEEENEEEDTKMAESQSDGSETADSGSETEGEEEWQEIWTDLPTRGTHWEDDDFSDPNFWGTAEPFEGAPTQEERAPNILDTHFWIPVNGTYATIALIWPKQDSPGQPKYIFVARQSGLLPGKNVARFLKELGDMVHVGGMLIDDLSVVARHVRRTTRSVVNVHNLASLVDKVKGKLSISSATEQ